MNIWVAYNDYGDLVADGHSYAELIANVARAGYYDDEVMIGKVTP